MNLQGTGLFVFSDPGGAKAILAMALQESKTLEQIFIVSDREYGFYKDFGLRVEIIRPGESKYIIEKTKFDFVMTGTSYTSKIELEFIAEAKKKKIPTYSFIDHWTSIKDRFMLNNTFILPDTIFVIDERALRMAVKEGLDEEIVKVSGNPYHTFLKNWKPHYTRQELLGKLGIDRKNPALAVFAPDPLSNINGKSKYGFDELSATKALSESIDGHMHDFTIILKAHPNQNILQLKKVKGKEMIFADASIDSTTLMFYSDVVIGFFSNFLLEASILKKKILRFHPVRIKTDPIAELNIGRIVNAEELFAELKNMK